ncbi:hypothetical protein C8T65DRAFT_739466 [Cerioporus squamosus]|nr:hypothetical protein C8T65DRAFT_739466 [Cerioporus squamosus]
MAYYAFPPYSYPTAPAPVQPTYSYYPAPSYPYYGSPWGPYPMPPPHYVYAPHPSSFPPPQPMPVPVFYQIQNHAAPTRLPFPQASGVVQAPSAFPAQPSPPFSPDSGLVKAPSASPAGVAVSRAPGVLTDTDIRNALHRAGLEDNRKERALAAKRTLAKTLKLPNFKKGPSMAVAEAILNPENIIFKGGAPSSEADMLERWNQTEFFLGPVCKTTHFQGTRPKKRGPRVSKISIDRVSLRFRLLKYKCQVELNERSREKDFPEVCDARPVIVKHGVNCTFTRPAYTQFKPSKLRIEIKKRRPDIPRASLLSRIA